MSTPTTLGLSKAASGDRSAVVLPQWLAGVMLLLTAVAGAVLVGRRAAGALDRPLPAGTLVMLGIALAAMAAGARRLGLRNSSRTTGRNRRRLAPWCPTVLVLLIAAGVHLQGTSPAGIALFWSAVAIEEGATAWIALQRRRRAVVNDGLRNSEAGRVEQTGADHSTTGAAIATVVTSSAVEQACPQPSVPAIAMEESRPGSQVTQQFVRAHSTAEGDVFSGWLRVEVPPGGRTASAHVAFCPPFARTPAIEIRQIDGPPGRIKTVQSLPYGARLDVKLNQPSDAAATVLLRLVASLTEA